MLPFTLKNEVSLCCLLVLTAELVATVQLIKGMWRIKEGSASTSNIGCNHTWQASIAWLNLMSQKEHTKQNETNAN